MYSFGKNRKGGKLKINKQIEVIFQGLPYNFVCILMFSPFEYFTLMLII